MVAIIFFPCRRPHLANPPVPVCVCPLLSDPPPPPPSLNVRTSFMDGLQVKGSFYVLVRKAQGNILNSDLDTLFNDVKTISKKLYNKLAEMSTMFRYNYF